MINKDEKFQQLIRDFKNIEFANKSDILHKNSNENGLTYYGIYQAAHPNLPMWFIIKENIKDAKGNLKLASEFLAKNKDVQDEVGLFYYHNFYLKKGLNKIISYRVVKKIFFFMIVQNRLKRPIRYAQQIVGVKEDGYLGNITAKAINNFDVEDFLQKYTVKEVEYFCDIVKTDLYRRENKKKNFYRYFHGWVNRAFKT